MPYFKQDNPNKPNVKNGCSTCKKPISEVQSFMKCDNCLKNYHLPCKSIFGINISRISNLSEWFCSESCGANPTSSVSSPVHGKSNSNVQEDENNQVNETNFQKIESMFHHISKQIEEVKHSQTFLNEQFEDIKQKYAGLAKENKQLRKEVDDCKTELSNQKTIIIKMQGDMDDNKQQSIDNNVVIAGCPRDAYEKPKDFVEGLFNFLGVDNKEILEAYAIKNTRSSIQNSTMIITKLKTAESKQRLMANKREKKTIFVKEIQGWNAPDDQQLFIRDQLTPLKSSLFKEARNFKNQFKYAFVWYKHHKIYLRKTPNSKIETIHNWNDLKDLRMRLERQSTESTEHTNSRQ